MISCSLCKCLTKKFNLLFLKHDIKKNNYFTDLEKGINYKILIEIEVLGYLKLGKKYVFLMQVVSF